MKQSNGNAANQDPQGKKTPLGNRKPAQQVDKVQADTNHPHEPMMPVAKPGRENK